MTTHVLILCTHNSARGVLSEAMLNHLAARLGKDVKAHRAGKGGQPVKVHWSYPIPRTLKVVRPASVVRSN